MNHSQSPPGVSALARGLGSRPGSRLSPGVSAFARGFLAAAAVVLWLLSSATLARADQVRLFHYKFDYSWLATSISTNPPGSMASDDKSCIEFTYGQGATNWTVMSTVTHSSTDNSPPLEGFISTETRWMAWTNLNDWFPSLGELGRGTYYETNYNLQVQADGNGGTTYVIDTPTYLITNAPPPTISHYAPFAMGVWSYTGDGVTNLNEVVSQASLFTSQPVNGTGGAFFRLTAQAWEEVGLPFMVPIPPWNLEVVGETPNAAGHVWKEFADGSVTDVTVSAPGYDYYIYQVYAERAQLTGLEWWNPATSNWSTGPLFVLVGTTVDFKVSANLDPVPWPATMPSWQAGSQTQAGGTMFRVTFTNVSTSVTNPTHVTVSAGNSLGVPVVVFDFQVGLCPDLAGQFPGRSLTRFGVGEGINLRGEISPEGLTAPNVGEIGWSASGIDTTGNALDQSELDSASSRFAAGAFAETITITGTLLGGVSAGGSRTTQFQVVKPTNVVLKDFLLTITNSSPIGIPGPWAFLADHTNVGHVANSESCRKLSALFLEPRDVSFHGIETREGAGPYRYNGGLFAANTGPQGLIGFAVRWSMPNGPVVTNRYHTEAQHLPQAFRSASHQWRMATSAIEPNYLREDIFGGDYGTLGNAPYPGTNAPALLTILTGSITNEYRYKSGQLYFIANVFSRRFFHSDGRLEIEKGGSGSHSKAYGDVFSPH